MRMPKQHVYATKKNVAAVICQKIHSFLCILLTLGEAEGFWNMLIMPSDCINISFSSEILGPQILSLKTALQKKTLCDLSKKIPNHRKKLLFDSTSLPYKNLQASKK